MQGNNSSSRTHDMTSKTIPQGRTMPLLSPYTHANMRTCSSPTLNAHCDCTANSVAIVFQALSHRFDSSCNGRSPTPTRLPQLPSHPVRPGRPTQNARRQTHTCKRQQGERLTAHSDCNMHRRQKTRRAKGSLPPRSKRGRTQSSYMRSFTTTWTWFAESRSRSASFWSCAISSVHLLEAMQSAQSFKKT